MTQERETHFQGFAKLLWDELMMAHGGSYGYIDVSNDGLDKDLIADYQQIIARRCIGYVGHPFEKEDLWTVITSLFFSVRGTQLSI